MDASILISFRNGQVLLEGENFSGKGCRSALERAAALLQMSESAPPQLKPEYYQSDSKIREGVHEPG